MIIWKPTTRNRVGVLMPETRLNEMPIAEKIDFALDIEELRRFFETQIQTVEPIWQTEQFGGWSLTSSNGDYRDGWHQAHRNYVGQTAEQAQALTTAQGVAPLGAFRKPTQLCGGPFLDFIQRLEQAGFYPRRARLICLRAGGASSWHRDAADTQYAVRLHVPITTNAGCFFQIGTPEAPDQRHLKAGDVYLLKVNRLHRVINSGSEDRIHLVINVFDTKQVSKHHQFNFDPSFLNV